MDVAVKQLPKSTVELKISLTPEEMQTYFKQAVKNISEKSNVPGFRQGKVPRRVLEQRTGPHHIVHEAMELAVTESYYKAIKENKLLPISRPQTELPQHHDDIEKKGLSFTATVPVMPSVELGDYKKVRVKAAKSEYSDKSVDEALEQLRQGRASFAQVSRDAKKGDRVEIDFVGTQNGKEVPGAKSENHPLVIGQGGFVPGFEDELVGMKKGQVKKFKVTFPKDYREKAIAGKLVEFTATMRQVQETKLPDLTDDFAKGLGAKSLDELKQRLATNLKQEKEQEARQKTEQAVVDKVVAGSKAEVPDAMAEEELTRMYGEFRQHVERQGMSFDQFVKQSGQTEEKFRKEQRPEAVRRVKLSLVLNAVQEAEKVSVPESEVDAEIEVQLARAPSDNVKSQVKSEEFRGYVRRILGNRRAVSALVKYATA